MPFLYYNIFHSEREEHSILLQFYSGRGDNVGVAMTCSKLNSIRLLWNEWSEIMDFLERV
jgi:hypothetical protein